MHIHMYIYIYNYLHIHTDLVCGFPVLIFDYRGVFHRNCNDSNSFFKCPHPVSRNTTWLIGFRLPISDHNPK